MNKLFWPIVIFDAIMLFYGSLRNEGAPGFLDNLSALITVGLSILLAAIAWIYWTTQSQGLRQALLVLVALPAAAIGAHGVVLLAGAVKHRNDPKYEDPRIAVFAPDPALTGLMSAIYHQDAAKVRALAPQVDLNAVAVQDDYTPLKLAAELSVEADQKAQQNAQAAAPALEIVRLLLSLGAKPHSALSAASYRASRTDAVRLLLDAGADPNTRNRANPAFFMCFSALTESVGLECLRLMKDHGADLAYDRDTIPPIHIAAQNGWWDTVLYIHDTGVPLSSGRVPESLGSDIQRALYNAELEKREPNPALKRLAELWGKEAQ